MTKFYIVLFILGVLLLLGCEKQDPECYLFSPAFTVNGISSETGTIPLEILNNGSIAFSLPQEDGYVYEWTGPNGFTSSLSSPVINNATNAMSGTYTLKLSKGICSSETAVDVEINAIAIPCTPQNNKLVFTEGLNPVTFSTILTSTNTDVFVMQMNGSNGDLQINFANATAPETGIYTINTDCPTSFLDSNEICMSLTYSGNFCVADAGEVYITRLDNGKYTVLFCNVKFNPTGEFPVEMIGSALITQE